MYDWSSSNTAVATLTSPTLYTVAVGTATGSADVELQSVFVRQNCPLQLSTPHQPISVACPSSVSIANTTNVPLEDGFPTYKTGIGMVASMQVGPPPTVPYNGSTISEALSGNGVLQNTCPAKYFSECNGGVTFTVGTAASEFVLRFPATDNIFYDPHSLLSASNLLGEAGLSTCTYSCNQTYYAATDPAGNSCGGANIGSFIITYTFNTSTIDGTPVTRATVTEQ